MVRTMNSMIRITAMVTVLLSIGAIGLGRLSPNDRGRTSGPLNVVGLSSSYNGPHRPGLHLFDLSDGHYQSLRLNPFERIDLAIGSHWADSWDQVQVVGRWTVNNSDGIMTDCGLSRVAYPSGQVLDRVPLDHYPTTTPCWASGTAARIFFVSGDGNLHRYDFEPTAESTLLTASTGLKQVRWEVEPSITPRIVLIDISRPEGLLAPDLLLASVMQPDLDSERRSVETSEIWWLRLGPDSEAIIDCGPVTIPDPEGLDIGRRRPSLGVQHDGTLSLAYLSWKGVTKELCLRIAPVELNEHDLTPVMVNSSGQVLAHDCLNTAPIFSNGGSSIMVQVLKNGNPEAERIALDRSSTHQTDVGASLASAP